MHGRRLVKVGWPGVFHFVQSGEENYHYYFDCKTAPGQVKQKSRRDYELAGCEYLGQAQAWIYFRRQVNAGESPEITSDHAALLKKYKRQHDLFILAIPVCLLWIPMLVKELPARTAMILVVIDVLVVGCLLVSFQQISQRIRALNTK